MLAALLLLSRWVFAATACEVSTTLGPPCAVRCLCQPLGLRDRAAGFAAAEVSRCPPAVSAGAAFWGLSVRAQSSAAACVPRPAFRPARTLPRALDRVVASWGAVEPRLLPAGAALLADSLALVVRVGRFPAALLAAEGVDRGALWCGLRRDFARGAGGFGV